MVFGTHLVSWISLSNFGTHRDPDFVTLYVFGTHLYRGFYPLPSYCQDRRILVALLRLEGEDQSALAVVQGSLHARRGPRSCLDSREAIY
jgi:hypothetical protein